MIMVTIPSTLNRYLTLYRLMEFYIKLHAIKSGLFHLGFHCLQKYQFRSLQSSKGLPAKSRVNIWQEKNI